jgi:hypothetical protein
MQSEPPTALAPDRPDYGWLVDRVAIARAERRRQAMEELEFERERAAALQEEIARLVVELEGPRLDEEVFARLAPADVELVQSSFQSGPAADDVDDEWFEIDADDPETLREETEQEIRRLEAEIAASGRRQDAFERYLEALGE